MERTVLTGSNDDQRAEQLLNILREREISVEELKEIMPTNKEFINSLMTALTKTIDADAESDKAYTDAIKQMANNITDIIRDGEVSEKERQFLFQMLKDLSDKLHEQKMDRDKQSQQNKRFYVGVGALVLVVLGVLAGKRIGGDKSDLGNKA